MLFISGLEGEVMDIEKVLNDYRSGDEDKRLSLFLFYRDLRDEFSSIDRDGEGAQVSKSRGLKWVKQMVSFP